MGICNLNHVWCGSDRTPKVYQDSVVVRAAAPNFPPIHALSS